MNSLHPLEDLQELVYGNGLKQLHLQFTSSMGSIVGDNTILLNEPGKDGEPAYLKYSDWLDRQISNMVYKSKLKITTLFDQFMKAGDHGLFINRIHVEIISLCDATEKDKSPLVFKHLLRLREFLEDSYIHELFLDRKTVDYPPLQEDFTQIEIVELNDGITTSEKIRKYFLALSDPKNASGSRPILGKDQVEKFIKKNFKIFGEEPYGIMFSLNINNKEKGRIAYFFHEFWVEFGSTNRLDRPAKLLKHNFVQFENNNLVWLKSNMSKPRGKQINTSY